jgi:hypothetical protein
LAIEDETIYRWKALRRADERRGHIYVEPARELKLLLGTIAVTGRGGVRVFDLSPTHRLGFYIQDGDIMLVDLEIHSHAGDPIVRMTKGHVRILDDAVSFEQRPGRIRIVAPLTDHYVAPWTIDRLRIQEPNYAEDGRLALLDLEVLEPGLLRVQGLWAHGQRAVVITKERLAFIWPELQQPLSMIGAGADSVLMYDGPISAALFGYSDTAPAALSVDQAKPAS